jgi:elongation factor P
MYRDPTHLHLMDTETYDQFQLAIDDAPDQVPYVTEGLEGMFALIYEDRCVGLQLPSAVDLDIAECDPAVRGNSATARTKLAKLETGLEVQVPEYIKQGEKIRVNTLTGEFVSRA